MNALPPSQLSPTETECPMDGKLPGDGEAENPHFWCNNRAGMVLHQKSPDREQASAANSNNVTSRSCSRCGSIGSNKSTKTNTSHHSACHELSNNDQSMHIPEIATHSCCNGNYTADSDAEQYFVNNVSHRSSMTHIPTDLVSYGSCNSLSHRSRTPVNGDGGSSTGATHKHGGSHHHPHPHQYHYQQHHTSCKKVALQGRGHCRHRRKSSSSTLPDSIIHRRDTDSSSVRGSESCIYEPLHVDVSSPSTANNTVILTPSKITIERNHGEPPQMVRDTSSSDLPDYVYTPSPVKWHFPAERVDKKPTKDTDYIEVVSEPECSAPDEKEVKKFTYDSKTISVWRTDNEETTNTVIYHHESEAVENCCDNYYFHCKADGEIENCSGVSCEFISTNNIDCCDQIVDNINNDNVPAKQIESLNNMVAIASHPTTPLINFHKNNISTLSTRLDLSPELRRYSKFTNLQQQNDTNLTPHHFPTGNQNSNGVAVQNGNNTMNQNLECNYFSDNKFVNTMRDVPRNQQQPQQQQHQQQPQSTQLNSPGHPQINSESSYYLQTNQNAFELFNISNSTLYEKPFGSINLTTQNQFEPFSNRQQSGNNNNNNGSNNNNNNNNETSDIQIHREYNAGQANDTGNMRLHGDNSRINMDNGDRHGGEANGLGDGGGGSGSNGGRRDGAGDDDADGDNNNHTVNTRDESMMSRLLTRRRHLGLGGLFREVRKRARKYTDNNRRDT